MDALVLGMSSADLVIDLGFFSSMFVSAIWQTIRFKSYLLSMGIANPVTRETHGSGTQYHIQLAKQLGDMLQAPLEVMTLLFLYSHGTAHA